MNIQDIIVYLILIVVAGVIVRYVYRQVTGKGSGCNCSSCPKHPGKECHCHDCQH